VPPLTTVTSPFGQVTLSWRVDGNRITRELTVRVVSTLFPPDDYEEIRAFLDDVRNAERTSIVLARRDTN